MRNKTLQKNLKHRLSLLLCLMAFLAVGQSAWGTTYYVWGGVSNSKQAPSAMSRLGNTATTSFTITDAAWLSKDVDNYYVIFTTSSDTPASTVFDEGHVNSHIKCAATAQSGSVTAGVQDIYVGNSRYYYLRFSLSANVQSVTISLSNLASSNPTTATYTVSTGGSPTPTTDKWYLAGTFNEWSTSANPFSGSGTTQSCTVYLTAKQYPRTSEDGFKVVKKGSSTTWYGNDTDITRSNSTTPITLTNSGNFGLTADIDGEYTFTITNLSGNPSLTVGYPSLAPPTYAIARWGDKATIDGSNNINASAYVATHGCNGNQDYTVTQLKVRYWKEGDEANSEVKETTTGTYSPGTAYQIVIPYTSNVLMNCTTASKIIMEVACKNGLGWSAYSDRMAVIYQASHVFVTSDLGKAFTACEGNHQFTLSEMVKPVPDSWTVTSGGAEAKSEFTLTDGEMIWKPGDKTTGTYNYTFTFSKDGYEPVNPTLTINYEKTAPTDNVSITTPSTSPVNATKFEEVSLVASKGEGVYKIKWSVTPDTYITPTNTDGTNATFQGKAIKTYTVTAVGLSASCGETAASNSVTINVSKDTEECNE